MSNRESEPNSEAQTPGNGAPPDPENGQTRASFLKRTALAGVAASGATTLLGWESSSAAAQASRIAPKYIGKKIGVPVYTYLDGNEIAILNGMKVAVSKAGLKWNLVTIDTKASEAEAQTALSALITQKVDLIIDVVVPAAFIEAQLAQAKKAGIPVVGNFTNAPYDPNIVADWSQPLDEDAVLMAHYLINDQLNNRKRRTVNVGMLDSPLPVVEPRRWVFEAIAANFAPKVKIVAQDFNISLTNTVTDAASRAKAMLIKHPSIHALWCNYPPITAPIVSAVSQTGRKDVQVYGHNANGGADLVRGGTPLVATTHADYVYQGFGLVDLALQVLSGKKPSRQLTWVYSQPTIIFDITNVNQEVPKGTSEANWRYYGGTYEQNFISKWNKLYAA